MSEKQKRNLKICEMCLLQFYIDINFSHLTMDFTVNWLTLNWIRTNKCKLKLTNTRINDVLVSGKKYPRVRNIHLSRKKLSYAQIRVGLQSWKIN